MPKRNGQPKIGRAPAEKSPKQGAGVQASNPRIGVNPSSYDNQRISWQFSRLDHEHDRWGWGRLEAQQCWELFTSGQLHHIESMTWQQLKSAAGGRNGGTNSHSIPVENLSPDAQRRLSELKLDDQDAVFSLRLTGKLRVIGFQAGSAFRVLWYDPEHEVCVSNKRNT